MSSSSEMKSTLENVLIPFEEINFATNGFEKKNQMGGSGFGPVYKGQLSERWGNRIAAIKRHDSNSYQQKQEFETELQIVSRLHHPNVISFIGYCDESKEMITVYEYAINGSLDHHLEDINRRSSLTWVQRLIICLGAARGLEYLHSGPGDHNRVIQSIFSSADILLDKNLEAKICNFGLSRSSPRNQQHTSKTSCYLDPLYRQSGVITKESHIYSFGVVLFELLSGMLAYNKKKVGDDMPQTLILSVRRNWQGGLEKIIDPLISDQIDSRSLNTFKNVAYKCISFNLEDRPTMARVIKKLEKALALQVPLLNYVIPLEEIILATNNFHENSRIGEGGFGKVYKGQLSQRWENRTAAIKCLRPECLQGKEGFEKELTMVSRFHHQNIIPFIGYCDEGDKMIMVYEYATNGCLDDHIRDPNKRSSITWGQRLKICLGAARGLEYLHSGLGDHNRVIHRDVKSANILLDDNMEAKICDFGLSRAAPRNQPHTQVHTKVAGTSFYCDPIYSDSGILTKEADIYSLGVVMFEMLSGLLAYGTRSIGGDKALPLINLVRQYENVGQENIIDPYIRDQINSHSLDTFKRVAYKCISFTLKERPTMDSIIENIEKALHFQENIDIGQQYDTDDNLDPQHDTDEDFDLQYDS